MGKVLNNVQPTSDIDRIARQHDIDYLINNGSQFGTLSSDVKAILASYLTIPSIQSLALRLGLGARSFLDLMTGGLINFNPSLKGLDSAQTRRIGLYLNSKLNSS